MPVVPYIYIRCVDVSIARCLFRKKNMLCVCERNNIFEIGLLIELKNLVQISCASATLKIFFLILRRRAVFFIIQQHDFCTFYFVVLLSECISSENILK